MDGGKSLERGGYYGVIKHHLDFNERICNFVNCYGNFCNCCATKSVNPLYKCHFKIDFCDQTEKQGKIKSRPKYNFAELWDSFLF